MRKANWEVFDRTAALVSAFRLGSGETPDATVVLDLDVKELPAGF
jgi:hypothetical protein